MITFEDALTLVSQKIKDIHYPKQPARLYEPIAYLLNLKGKKIRPALTLLAYNLYADDVQKAVNMALAWEIFHNFTLMHDDMMDLADLRRGELTVHQKWDNNTAILSGDAMLILAYKYLAKYPMNMVLKNLLDLFSITAAEICEGQEYDMQFETRTDVREEEYLNMIRLKTAVLVGACLKSGAILADADAKAQDALYDFGINIGIAFQIQDDLLDVYGNEAVFGKKIGGDILCNKKTFLLVCALNNSDEQCKTELLQWLSVHDQPDEKIKAVTELYDKLQLKKKAVAQIESYYGNALRALDKMNVAKDKKTVLTQLATELLHRTV